MFGKFKGLFQGTHHESHIKQLEAMGFERVHALNALEAAGGNFDEALNHLLTHQEATVASDDPSGLNRNTAPRGLESGAREGRSAASWRAGQAAAQRAMNAANSFGSNKAVLSKKTKNQVAKTGTKNKGVPNRNTKDLQNIHAVDSGTKVISGHHPDVKVPSKMADKSKEEQILRCSQRLAPYPLAVDTLLQALINVRDHPTNEKYRRIDMTSNGFVSVLKDKPGALDLLKAVNYVERWDKKDMVLSQVRTDPALLFLGISALEQARLSYDYQWNKALIRFHRELKHILDGSNIMEQSLQEQELIKRADYLSKVPSEPANGAGALLQVNLGESQVLSRRFDGDDTLQDIVHWIAAHGSSILDKLVEREWDLVDLNQYPVEPIEVVAENMNKTLQVIGCWPSGKLEIRPSAHKFNNTKDKL